MAQSLWTAEHAATLKALREAARLDPAVLAKRHSLSTTQVRQLEDGGESAFYSPQIKWAVGRKLTLALGGKLIAPEPGFETDPAPETTAASPMPAPGARPTAPPSPQARDFTDRASTPPHPPRRLGLWLSLGGLGLAMGLTWVMPATPPVQPPPAPASVAAPAPTSASESSESPPVASPTDATSPPLLTPSASTPEGTTTAPPSPTVAMAATPLAPEGEACRWVASPPDMTPALGQRPDNYVHVVAQDAVTVCWRDAEKKTRKQRLQASEATSFWGTPPFQVYASDPKTLKVYFKGQVVRWDTDSDVGHIVLGTRPASTN